MKTGLKYLLLLCLCARSAFSQNTGAISKYLNQLKSSGLHDTSRCTLYVNLTSEYSAFKNDSAIYYADLAEKILQKFPNEKLSSEAKYLKAYAYYTSGDLKNAQLFVNQSIAITNSLQSKGMQAKGYNLLGAILFNEGDFDKAIEAYNNKLKIATEFGDTKLIIETHYNLSLINNDEGNYYRSLEHNYTALHLAESIQDTSSIMIAYEGLGISYTKIQDTKNAISYLERALKIASKRKAVYVQSGIMVDLANVYRQNNEFEKALSYYKKGEDIATKDGDKLTTAIAVSGKAETYLALKNYNEAIKLFYAGLDLYKEIIYPRGIAENYLNLAKSKLQLNNYKEAKVLALQSLEVLKTIKGKQLEEKSYEVLSKAYEKLGKPDSAFICFRLHNSIKDTLTNRAALKKISEYESTIEKDRMEQERLFAENAAKEELDRQKQIRNTTIATSVVILLLLIVVYRNFKLKQKANIEISEQKKIIEHKNKDILDSINYSKRLQEAVLTAPEEIKRLLPESFVLYKPKTAVSKDFYFIEEGRDKNEIHVALASGTDAGVPGAFMSIIGHNLLKKALKETRLKDPAAILEYVNTEMRNFLRIESGTEQIKQGLDLSYCILNFKSKQIQFAGANNSFWISSQNKKADSDFETASEVNHRILYRIKGEKLSIGFYKEEHKFKNHTIKAEEGDVLFLYTGIFPGDQNKEIGEKHFPKLLNAGAHHAMDIAKIQLENEILKSQTSKDQISDTCIIGIKI
jgi:tetratricopeptide (TPR) repeat protein